MSVLVIPRDTHPHTHILISSTGQGGTNSTGSYNQEPGRVAAEVGPGEGMGVTCGRVCLSFIKKKF